MNLTDHRSSSVQAAPAAGTAGVHRVRERTRFGPAAVVTGASSGIGAAFAESLAARGVDLLLVSRRGDRLEAMARRLATAHGVNVRTLALDLGTPGAAQAVVNASADLEVGTLVCSAGFGASGPFIDTPVGVHAEMATVNCTHLAELTWFFARRFVAQRRGNIVLMSSLVGFQGVPGAAMYAASKAFVQSLAEGLHHELRPHGVWVTASAPGPVATEFASRAGMRMGAAGTATEVAEGTLAKVGRRLTVRPGWLSVVLEWSLKTLPRWGRVRMMQRVMAGMVRGSEMATSQNGKVTS